MEKKHIDILKKLVPSLGDVPSDSDFWLKRSAKALGASTHDRDTYPVLDPHKGQGLRVYDIEGNEYLDITAGVAVKALGSRNPELVEFEREISHVVEEYSGQDFDYISQVLLSERLASLMPNPSGKKKQSFFTTSGARAIEIAIKSAMDMTRRHRFVGFRPAFHGRTGYALTMTASKAAHREYFPAAFPVVRAEYAYCYRCPFNLKPEDCAKQAYCAELIRSFLSMEGTDIAGVLFEPICGEGGIIVPPASFAQSLRKLADDYGAVLIADEIQCGMGRSGKWWAFEHSGIEADTVCAAKSLGAGWPMGVAVGNEPMFTGPGRNSETFSAEPRMALLSLFVLRYIEDKKLIENAAVVGEYILGRLKEFVEKYECVGDARGMGLMLGIEIVEDKKSKKMDPATRDEIVNNAVNKQRLLVLGSGKCTIRILPPLIITMEEAKEACDKLEKAIQEVSH
jgi:4-aminobutyrate aminotransferase